jgi:hypothetical protein
VSAKAWPALIENIDTSESFSRLGETLIILKMIPALGSGEPANLLESANGEIGKHCSAIATRTRSH